MKPLPITTPMIKRLHALYRQYNLEEEQYRAMIKELTGGRTDSTKELTADEARYLSGYITGKANVLRATPREIMERSLRQQRSAVLKRLQKIGIDTTEWSNVNAYLQSPRIAGKPLYKLDSEELAALIPKLESMLKKKKNGKA